MVAVLACVAMQWSVQATTVNNDQSASNDSYEDRRRSVYLPVIRNDMYDLYSIFDYPDASVSFILSQYLALRARNISNHGSMPYTANGWDKSFINFHQTGVSENR